VCYPYEKLPSRECANLINVLPTEIRTSYIFAILSSAFSGILMCLSIVAYFYPSIISIWLLWEYVTHCEGIKEYTHSYPESSNSKPQRNVLVVHPIIENKQTVHPATVDDAVLTTSPSAAGPRLAVYALKRYKGEIEESSGKKHGYGTFTYDNGDVYEGYFVKNKKVLLCPYHDSPTLKYGCISVQHGIGTYRYANGDVFSGSFEAGLKHGKGRYSFKVSGDVYEGDYFAGVIHGQGIYSYGDGARLYYVYS